VSNDTSNQDANCPTGSLLVRLKDASQFDEQTRNGYRLRNCEHFEVVMAE